MAEADSSSSGRLFRPGKVARTICVAVLVTAAAAAGFQAVFGLLRAREDIRDPSRLPPWVKILDDHGLWAVYVFDAAQRTGERDPIAFASREGIDVARYYLFPRPVYVLSADLPNEPVPPPSFIARHRAFFVQKGIRWLIWSTGPTVRRPDGKLSTPPPLLLDVRKLIEGTPEPGVALTRLPSSEPHDSAADYLVATLVIAAVVGLGWIVRPLVIRGARPGTWPESLPRLFALGLVALYALSSGLLLLGIGLSHGLVLYGGLGLLLLVALRCAFLVAPLFVHPAAAPGAGNQRGALEDASHRGAVGREGKGASGRGRALRVLALLLVAVSFLLVAGKGLVMPVRNIDALHHWGFAAKVLFYEGGVRNSAYLDPDRGYDFRRYPLLTPILMGTIHLALGRVNDQAVKVVFPVFFGMMLLALGGAMRRERPGVGGGLWLACLATSLAYLNYGGGAVSELADVPLSFFLLLGLIEWRRWVMSHASLPKVSHLREGIPGAFSPPEGVNPSGKADERGIPSRRCETFGREDGEAPREGEAPAEPFSILRWLLPLCGAAVTKTEGLVPLAAALVISALVRWRVRPIPWAAIVPAAAAVAVLVLPWYAFASRLPGSSIYVAERPLGETLARNLPQLLPNIGQVAAEATDYEVWRPRSAGMPDDEEHRWEHQHWGLFWIGVGIAFLAGWRGSGAGNKLVLGVLAVQVAAYLLSYVLTPHDAAGLVATTKMRFLLHLAPAAAYLAWAMFPRLPSWLEAEREQA